MRSVRFPTRLGAVIALVVMSATVQAAERWIFKAGAEPVVRNVRLFSNLPVAGQTTLITSTLGAGVVKVVDTGTSMSWQQLNNGLPSLRIRNVGGFSTTDFYALTERDGVYHSIDGGASWTAANGSGGGALGCKYGQNMSVRSLTEVWVVTNCSSASGVWRTTDGGANWTRLGTATIPADAQSSSLSFNGATTVVYASQNYGLYRSDDSGANWAAINNGFPLQGGAGKMSVSSVAFGASGAEMLAVLDDAGVYKSIDSGANWLVANTDLPSTNIVAGVSRESNTTFYVGVDGYGVYRTTNTGANWAIWGTTNTNLATSFVRSVSLDLAGRRYLNTLEGIVRTADNGTTFADVPDLPPSSVNSISVGPDGKKAMVAAAGVVRVEDITVSSWTDNESNFTDFGGANGLVGTSSSSSTSYHDTDPNFAYTTLDSTGLYSTSNAGANWTPLTALVPGPTERIRYRTRPGNHAEIWAGLTNPFLTATGGGLHRSINSGATWTSLGATLPDARSRHINRVAVHATDTALIFLATAGGIYRSLDTGATWSLAYSAVDAAGSPVPVSFVARDQVNTSLVYASVDYVNPDGSMTAATGVLRSMNSGANWTNVLPNLRVRQVRLQGNGTAFALIDNDLGQPAMMVSRDAGATWTDFSRGLTVGTGRNVGQGASPDFRVKMLTTDGGIFLRVNPDSKDLNADDKSDLLWSNTADGSVQAWLMNGLNATWIAGLLPAGGGFTVTHVADMNADGRADLLISHTDGRIISWLMDGVAVSGLATLAPAGTGYSVVKTGDFDGDGKADILIQHTSGIVQGWLLDGTTVKSTATFVGAGSGWSPVQVGDFNGDGKADIVWKNTDGSVQLWLMNGLAVSSIASFVPAGTGWSPVLTGDFNGDGNTDLVWQHTDGRSQCWLMNGTNVIGLASFTPAGTGWTPKLAGDIDGDGKDDLFWEHTNGASQTWLMNGVSVTGVASFVAAGPWRATHLLDLNADGKKDVFWRNTNGSVQAWTMNGLTITGLGMLAPPGTYLMIP